MTKKITLTFLLILLFICGCGTEAQITDSPSTEPSIVEEETVFDISQYKSSASSFNDAVSENMLALYNMGKYEYNYWNSLENLGGSPDFSTMPDTAFEWLSENSSNTKDSVLSAHESICQQYADLIIVPIEGSEAEEIETLVKDIYSSYVSYYDLMTSPSGSIDNFATSFNTYTQSLKHDTETLSLLIAD